MGKMPLSAGLLTAQGTSDAVIGGRPLGALIQHALDRGGQPIPCFPFSFNRVSLWEKHEASNYMDARRWGETRLIWIFVRRRQCGRVYVYRSSEFLSRPGCAAAAAAAGAAAAFFFCWSSSVLLLLLVLPLPRRKRRERKKATMSS